MQANPKTSLIEKMTQQKNISEAKAEKKAKELQKLSLSSVLLLSYL